MPFFSIVIPTYNSGKTIFTTLKSIMVQDFTDYEIVIIDNASEDDTISIIDTFNCNKLLKVIEKDKGVYDAMNKGIKKSAGRWLLFLGSDDELYANDTLKKVHEFILDQNYKFVYGNVIIQGSNDTYTENQIYDGEFNLQKLVNKNICQQAIFYNSALFKEIGLFNIDYFNGADYDFNLKCFARTEIHFLDVIVSRYSLTGQSSKRYDHRFFDDFGENLVKLFFFQLFKHSFTDKRLFIRQAVHSSRYNIFQKIYLVIIYIYHKLISILKRR
jgi:glycosyltransferase involved in cell wall biosynthesis